MVLATDSVGAALLAIAVLSFGVVKDAGAQDRMPPIPADRLTAEQRKAVDEFVAARGNRPDGPFTALLRSPEVMSRARAMGDYLRFKSVLPPRLSEFVILLTAREWTQNYEWAIHHDLAVAAGLSPQVAKAIADGRRPDGMREDEEILYNFCTELQRNRSISDDTYSRMVSKFGESGVIDTTGIVGYYTLLAMALNTARTPVPAGTAPALAPFPR